MAWARIDDNFFSHPKVRKAGKDAVILYLAALCHSNCYVTEGFIADDVLELIGIQSFQNDPKPSADKLTECGLFIRVEGGYQIHDFLEYNYSRQQINDIKAKRAEAGRQGGRPAKQNESKMKANEKQNESHTHTHAHTPSHIPIPIPDTPTPTNSTPAVVFEVYENEIGLLTPFVAEEIKVALEDYPEEWIVKAIRESVAQNKRSWKYALAILKRWKVEGVDGNKKKEKGQGQSLEYFRQLYRESKQKEKDV